MSKNDIDRRDYKTPPSSRNTGNTSREAWVSQAGSYAGGSSHAKSKLEQISNNLDTKSRLQSQQSAAESGLAAVQSAMQSDAIDMKRTQFETSEALKEKDNKTFGSVEGFTNTLNRASSAGNTVLSILDTVEQVGGGTDASFDQGKYDDAMSATLEQIMGQDPNVKGWEDVEYDTIMGAHKKSLDNARDKQGWFGKGVGGTIAGLDRVFQDHGRLRKEQKRTAKYEKMVQSNIAPPQAVKRMQKLQKDHVNKMRMMTDEHGNEMADIMDMDLYEDLSASLFAMFSMITPESTFIGPTAPESDEIPAWRAHLDKYAAPFTGGAK